MTTSNTKKMKATEFRIGNHYDYHMEGWMELSIIDCDDFRLLINNPDDNNYHPIPISDEELLKFGFQKGYFGDFFWNGVFQIIVKWGKYYLVVGGKHIHIQYIHRLQNLFFSLTEQELIYTP